VQNTLALTLLATLAALALSALTTCFPNELFRRGWERWRGRRFQSQVEQRRCATAFNGSTVRGESLFAFSYSAFGFRAAAFANVGHLYQAIAELDCLARLGSRWSVFLGRHSATTARTDHDWLFLARRHGREVNMMRRCRKENKISNVYFEMSFAWPIIGAWAASERPAGAIHRHDRPQSDVASR